MKRLIDSKLVKKVKAFLTGNNYDEDTNTTEIGGKLEVDKDLEVHGDAHIKALFTACDRVVSPGGSPGLYFENVAFNRATSTISPLILKSWKALALISETPNSTDGFLHPLLRIEKLLTLDNKGVVAGGENTLQTQRGWNTLFTINSTYLRNFTYKDCIVASGFFTYSDSVQHRNAQYSMRLSQQMQEGNMAFVLEIYIDEDGVTITPSDLSASGTTFKFE